MFHPKINVLILNWNGIKVLHDCVQSIINNKYNNFSITIIDNGSIDNSLNEFYNRDIINIINIKNIILSPFS